MCTSVLRSDREPVHTRQGPLRCGRDLVFVGKLARHCCQQHGRGASEVTTHIINFGPSSAASSLANLHLRPALRSFEGRVRVAAAASMHWFSFPSGACLYAPFSSLSHPLAYHLVDPYGNHTGSKLEANSLQHLPEPIENYSLGVAPPVEGRALRKRRCEVCHTLPRIQNAMWRLHWLRLSIPYVHRPAPSVRAPLGQAVKAGVAACRVAPALALLDGAILYIAARGALGVRPRTHERPRGARAAAAAGRSAAPAAAGRPRGARRARAQWTVDARARPSPGATAGPRSVRRF